ncbi:MAG: TonB-dependent receptor [Gammaproteobacteria bacterium]
MNARAEMRAARAASPIIMLVMSAPFAWAADDGARAAPAPPGVAAAPVRSPFEMEEIVVTATREARVWEMPRSVAVITADDIARSTTGNIVDLLAREANVNLRSFFGHDKFAGVDIRGMGDTFSSNVLVLVDGVRLNEVDLSGADFSSIPLDQIERIEVIRGANAVRYGSGAVGGVINIRTRRADATPRAAARVSAGSFDTYTTALDLGGGTHGFSAHVDAAYHDTDGFRDNGAFRKQDGAFELGYAHGEWLRAHVRAALHEDAYGIPGPIPRADLERSAKARQATSAPDDAGETMDRRYRARLTLDLGGFGEIEALARHRNRTNRFIVGYTPLLRVRDQQSAIESVMRNYEATWTLPYRLFGHEHRLVLGFETMSADYERRENGRGLVDRSRALVGRIGQHAGFIGSHWSLPHDLAVDIGYRHDRFRVTRREEALRRVCDVSLVDTVVETTVFVEVFPGFTVPVVVPVTVSLPVETNCRGELAVTPGQRERWRNEAWEAGLTWQPRTWLTGYFSWHRSFRNPNVDELTLASGDLGPQDGEHFELGVRVRDGARFEAALALFRMTVDDEIFYGFDPDTGLDVNFNLAQGTERHGVELELKGQLTRTLAGWLNASYLDARLAETDAREPAVPRNRTDTFIPLVPRDKLAAGLDWQPHPRLSLSTAVTYTGTRYDGNDFSNRQYDKLDAYHVVDAKLRWQGDGYALGIAVSNLTDQVFATAGYSGTVYPMAPRSVMAELALRL